MKCHYQMMDVLQFALSVWYIVCCMPWLGSSPTDWGLFVLSGSPYYDNVRPLSYPDSDAVLICFDISRPETLDSVLKKVGEISSLLDYYPDSPQKNFTSRKCFVHIAWMGGHSLDHHPLPPLSPSPPPSPL